MRSITITTFPATTRRETDPLIREFSPEVTEAREQVSVSPMLLLTEPGILPLQAKLAGAARMLLECVATEGHRAQSLTVTLVLEGPADAPATCRCGAPLLTEIQRITGECPGCAAESAERDAMALEHLDEEGRGNAC